MSKASNHTVKLESVFAYQEALLSRTPHMAATLQHPAAVLSEDLLGSSPISSALWYTRYTPSAMRCRQAHHPGHIRRCKFGVNFFELYHWYILVGYCAYNITCSWQLHHFWFLLAGLSSQLLNCISWQCDHDSWNFSTADVNFKANKKSIP